MTTIKKVTSEQVELLQAISRQTFFDTFGADNSEEDMADYLDQAYAREKLLAELENPASFFFFAWQKDHVVGYAKINIESAQTEEMSPNALELERIYVKSDSKHQGIGSQLFQQTLQVAKELGKTKVWLGVWEHNQAARHFYQKLGFRQIGEHIFQLGQDAQRDILMEKVL